MADEQGLHAQRDRLIERFALMQSELGGLFYEMAIRDHVRLDVLVAKAAALQAVDNELAQVEQLLSSDRDPAEAGGQSAGPTIGSTPDADLGESPPASQAPASGPATAAPSQ